MSRTLDQIIIERARSGDEAARKAIVTSVWSSIEKIVTRQRQNLSGTLKGHPLYGLEDSEYSLFKEDIADLLVEKVLLQFDPDKPLNFKKWFTARGYSLLWRETQLMIEEGDPRLQGVLDHRRFRWRKYDEVTFTVDEAIANERRFETAHTSDLKLPPSARLWRLCKYWAWLADAVTDETWYRILRDDEAYLIDSILRNPQKTALVAMEWGLDPSWVRRKAVKICEKAARAIRYAIDEKHGLLGIPAWPKQYQELQKYRNEWAPQYGRGKCKAKNVDGREIDSGWIPPVSAHDKVWHGGEAVSEGRREWGLKAARKDERRNRELERKRKRELGQRTAV